MQIALISDIHEDVLNLKKALKYIQKSDIKEIICLGDIVGYSYFYDEYEISRDASECLKIVRENCSICIAGNHDLHISGRIPEFKAGIEYPESWPDLDAFARKRLQGKIWLYDDELLNNLSPEDKKQLNSMSESHIVKFSGIPILLSHFLYPDFSGSTTKMVKNTEDVQEHLLYSKNENCFISFYGHSHPDGFGHGTEDNYQECPFGEFSITDELQCIGVPCITNGKAKNGILIFDTKGMRIEVIPLSKI